MSGERGLLREGRGSVFTVVKVSTQSIGFFSIFLFVDLMCIGVCGAETQCTMQTLYVKSNKRDN